jgi:hypothetical protein
MPDEEWVKTLDDGKRVKFIYHELPEDGAFITALLAGSEVVYSVVKTLRAISRASFQRSRATFWNTIHGSIIREGFFESGREA